MGKRSTQSPVQFMRIGHGYDLHRLELRPPEGKGRLLVLGGVRFEDHPTGPISHSDGDAVYHAVTDAILGALGLPDIGELFPDDDPRNESADSAVFMREAASRMNNTGYSIGNLDMTVICERPKLASRKTDMIANIARLLQCDAAQVNLKGKTHEKVDAVGEGRAIEVHVVAMLVKGGSRQEDRVLA
jgi:2-C-methyl-D-erythritol 2,4-cyclodiphosphate synthase